MSFKHVRCNPDVRPPLIFMRDQIRQHLQTMDTGFNLWRSNPQLPPEQSVELDINFNLSSSGIKSATLSEQDIKWGMQIYKYMPVDLHRLLEMRNPFTIPGRANVRVAANMFSWNAWRNKVRIGFPMSVCLKMEYIFSWFKKSCSPLQDCHALCASSSWLTKQPKKGRMSHCQTHPSNISWYPCHTMDGRNLVLHQFIGGLSYHLKGLNIFENLWITQGGAGFLPPRPMLKPKVLESGSSTKARNRLSVATDALKNSGMALLGMAPV